MFSRHYWVVKKRKMNQPNNKKIALVHDFLVSYGGAERVLEAFAEMFPEAPIYTLLANPELVEGHFKNRDIRPSFLQKFPKFLRKRYRWLLPFFPVAVETFDLRDFDLVISSSGAWSKGIVTRLNTTHIAYLHSPMRYAWDTHAEYLDDLQPRGKRRIFTRLLLSYLRLWDREAAERPDFLIANSKFTEERVRKYYRRESVVVYPPALGLSEQATKTLKQVQGDDVKRRHFLVVSRLTRAKKVEAVIEAFNKLGFPLVIVGTGKEEKRLKSIAADNVSFFGFASDEALAKYYRETRAVIFPSEEDFGMVAVEALSFGTPVIGYEYGGIREIVEPGITGELFHAATPEIIAEGVRRFLEKEGKYDETRMRSSVERFSKRHFQEEIRKLVDEYGMTNKEL